MCNHTEIKSLLKCTVNSTCWTLTHFKSTVQKSLWPKVTEGTSWSAPGQSAASRGWACSNGRWIPRSQSGPAGWWTSSGRSSNPWRWGRCAEPTPWACCEAPCYSAPPSGCLWEPTQDKGWLEEGVFNALLSNRQTDLKQLPICF